MYSLFYALFSGENGRYDSHRLRPRDLKAVEWRQAHAELERQARRRVDVPAKNRRGRRVQWRPAWPFNSGR